MKVKVHIGNAPHDCDEVRRLRGEVRRLRRALRGIHYSVSEPRGMAPVLVIMDGIKAACESALAPRRKK